MSTTNLRNWGDNEAKNRAGTHIPARRAEEDYLSIVSIIQFIHPEIVEDRRSKVLSLSML